MAADSAVDIWNGIGVDERLKYFTYMPAGVYPEVSLAVYFVVGTILVILGVRARAQRWVHILSGTAYAEALGYVFRTVCVTKTTFGLYVLMTLFLLLPPNAIALFNYKTIGEIIRMNNSRMGAKNKSKWRFWLKPKFVNWFYFSSDLFSIAMQGAGGGMMTSFKTRDTGKTVVLIGLVVQLFFFACFLVTAIYVWRKPEYLVQQGPRDRSQTAAKRKVMINITLTTVLLYIRSIYRIAEFADGYGGKIYSAEWAFYVFDTIVVFLAFLVYIILYIGPNFPRRSSGEALEQSSPSEDAHRLNSQNQQQEEKSESSAQLIDSRRRAAAPVYNNV
ncbi:hypothetical protein IW140_005373 [Coemansia sp. RSA 1813]|nr:hypothetical protein EV178_005168 [Coemansia sp. RSA 1646]KAJ1769072.1 hypothetical protein LPJ74_004370 [Coemansia sp. RSA 1843]KAJ2086894.1 hypothetical protein IW138_005370 [Coemansia sp. RSA 986]KAJ2211668.1 hypothetical protein EV179_005282 [Coemansia sp. RSA 487]KAJ2565379.1 hypothetical protein IW140_005373 [Coemansia sp. RSA 1813]